ncbi:MAG: cation transporter [Clostridiales bacterium]|nr:cation transporter [Clostridiales bacterium]
MLDMNYRKVKQVLAIILLANLAVAALKISLGILIKSTSMTADGFHSLTDGSSNIAGLIGIQYASKPIDEEHPYGHKKFEMLAGLFIALMLFVIFGKIIFEAILRLVQPVRPEVSMDKVLLLLVSLGINIFVCLYEYRQGKKLGSQILISDSMHTRSDIYVSIGVLVTLIGIYYGLPTIIDPIASFVVGGFILHAAIEIFRDNSGILLDKAMVDKEEIKSIALSFDQVKDIHNIRSRGTKNDLYIDMHIMTEPDMSVEKSHELTHDIEDKIRESIHKNVQIIAHIEPYEENEDL